MKKISIFIGLVALCVAGAWAANSDRSNLSGEGIYFGKDMVHTDSNYNYRLYNGSIFLGDNQLAPSTANTQTTPSITSGGYYGIKVAIKYTEAVTNGDVICSSNVATGNGRKCISSAQTTIIGIAEGTYASGSVGWMTISGYALVKSTGSVSIGDLLVSSASTSGYVGANNSGANGSVVGKALSAGAAAGDTILAIIGLQ